MHGNYRTTRNPMLLFLLSGVLLLRFADRQLLSLLFQLPPRNTRFVPTACSLQNRIPPSIARRNPRRA
jgi:hypothetical protein